MNVDLSSLAESLRERLAIIADHTHRDSDSAGHLQRLIDISTRIDSLVMALSPDELDPQFLHYLEKRSYDKALVWIENSET